MPTYSATTALLIPGRAPAGTRAGLPSRVCFTAFLALAFFLGMTGTASVVRGAVPGSPPYAWSVQSIAAFTDAGVYTSIALDASGNPYVAYVDGTNGTVDVAHRVAGAWTVERVDGPGSFAGDTNVVVAADGSVRLSYYDATVRQVKYAVRAGGTWQISDVDGGLQEGFNRLVLDSSGRPALTYVSFSGWLRYAWWNGTAWLRETVDDASVLSRYPDLTLDAAGVPRISYYADGLLRYAVKVGGVWVRDIVDPSLYAGWFSRIRVDPAGTVHIAYYDSVNGTLRWATRTAGVWSHTTLDGAGDAGWDLSLAVDDLGRTHIAYYARLTSSLRYLVNTTAGWVRETADEGGVVGWYTSIATDASGLPHISYYDWTNGLLDIADGRVALQARTQGAQAITNSTAVLHGELVALGNHTAATAGFQLRVRGTATWMDVLNGSLSSAGPYTVSVTNLTAGVVYEFRAEAAAGNEASYGAVRTFVLAEPVPPSPYGILPYVVLPVVAIAAVGTALLLRRWANRRAAP